ncbi:hypothetical protein LTS14_002434 [Recurvomyces mirabilis]|uniref:uncharacterized protein n=1 Tax=Recurvomyces mirabilis TaxID=574656 RepID=UPI002DE1BDFC|nr:hypothetical protein LTS14_002434 [Recurvomyces mirabilis]
MVVCQFFLQGRCKFGDSCKNEHPGRPTEANRFAPLSNGFGGGRSRAGGIGGGDRSRPSQDQEQKKPYNIDREVLAADLTTGGSTGEKPRWPLSVYGPGRDAPRQLLEGALEQSPEEMRLLCYEARAKGQEHEYVQHEATLGAQAQQQVQSILNDLDGAIKYVIDGEQQHPNRLDQCVKGSGAAITQSSGGFGQPSGLGASSTGSAFGRPSSTSAFGQPSGVGKQSSQAFGQPSQPASGFGAPSTLGGRSAFGASPQPASAPTFGAHSQPSSGGSAFGAPSSMGAQRPAFGQASQPAFGQASQPAFGQSAFGQASKPAFGLSSQPAAGTPFGAGQQQQINPFGGQPAQSSPFAAAGNEQSAFGQAAQTQSQPQVSPFASAGGAASNSNAAANPFAGKAAAPAFGAPPQPTASPFGAPSQPTASTFGAPSQPAASPFGGAPKPAASTFGQSSQPSGTAFRQAAPAPTTGFGFGQPSQPAAHTNGFGGQQATQPPAAPQTNGTGGATGIAATTGYTTRGRDGKLLMRWKGQPVTYETETTPPAPFYQDPQTGKPERIWLPDGPPDRPNPYSQAPPQAYEGDVGKLLKQVYDFVRDREEFSDIIPEMPPQREWLRWDL